MTELETILIEQKQAAEQRRQADECKRHPSGLYAVGDGWYVNTYTNTETKCSQIQLISDALGLGLKTEIIE